MKSANNERRRAQQAAKWAALPPEERQRIEAQNAVEGKILAAAGCKALDQKKCESCVYELTPELCPVSCPGRRN